ncbi:MAG: hypothetical protein AB8B51_03060 [Sedimentitalea sp.]
MKVTRNTPEQLILDVTPWLWGIGLVVFTLIFAVVSFVVLMEGDVAIALVSLTGCAMGALAFAVFVRRAQIILDRTADTLVIRRRSVFGYSAVEHPLSALTHAELDTTPGNQGRRMSRPVLVLGDGMSAGHHPITQAYTNSPQPGRMVDIINDWLKADQRAP